MKIEELIKLNDTLIKEVMMLEKLIQDFDNTARDIYLDNQFTFDQEMPINFLAREGNTLVGFLGIYADSKEDEELSVIVHPDYRRQGIATALIERARVVQKQYGIDELTFVTEKRFTEAHPFLEEKYDLNEVESELIMQTKLFSKNNHISFDIQAREATMEDVPRIAAFQAKSFGEPLEVALNYARSSLEQDDHTIYVFIKEGEIVGSSAVNITTAYYYLFSLAVDPDYQGQGVGTAGIYHTMKALDGLGSRPYRLAVESDNAAALHLYEKNGFEVLTEVLYLGGK